MPRRRTLRDYLLPHTGNGYHPHFFRAASVGALVLALLLLEGAYFVDTHLLATRTNFLASVLPGALIGLTNADRAAVAAPALTEDPTLDQAAALAAQDMAAKGYFAHVSPSGTTPWDWLSQVGYQYSYAGQNLAVNFTDSTDVEKAWMASPTHHANIVKPQYTRIGIGTANGMYQGQEVTFVVQYFATPAETPAAAAPEPTVTKPVEEPALVAVAQPKPAVVPKPKPATTDIVDVRPEAGTTVLGAEAAPSVVPTSASVLTWLTSPTYVVQSIAIFLLMVVAVLFAFAMVSRIRVPHPHLVLGGMAMILLLSGSILLNGMLRGSVHLPADTQQSASVVSAFQ